LDTDTTVHTLYGRQMGGRKSYNPKNRGKKSYQPILTFLADTREYIWGELRNGDRPTNQQIAHHLQKVFAALPRCVVKIFARADAGFIVGRRSKRTRKGRSRSSWWRARPRVDWRSCKAHVGGLRPAPTPTSSASSVSPGGLRKGLQFYCPALSKEGGARLRPRAVPAVRQLVVYLSGLRHQHEAPH